MSTKNPFVETNPRLVASAVDMGGFELRVEPDHDPLSMDNPMTGFRIDNGDMFHLTYEQIESLIEGLKQVLEGLE